MRPGVDRAGPGDRRTVDIDLYVGGPHRFSRPAHPATTGSARRPSSAGAPSATPTPTRRAAPWSRRTSSRPAPAPGRPAGHWSSTAGGASGSPPTERMTTTPMPTIRRRPATSSSTRARADGVLRGSPRAGSAGVGSGGAGSGGAGSGGAGSGGAGSGGPGSGRPDLALWLQVLAYVYFVGGIISAIYIAYDILKKRHMQKMPIMNVVWSISVFYLFPLGRWAYWHFGSYIFHVHLVFSTNIT